MRSTWSESYRDSKRIRCVDPESRDESLEKAHSQAMEYIQALKTAGREAEVPRHIVESDFATIALHDLDGGTSITFPLAQFHKHVSKFGFIPGYKQQRLNP